jgi:neutral ceramidase
VAGAARVDITPPPGYPLGGHSIAGRVARGHWTRLRARAFFFRDTAGRALALVSCDLFAVPAGLHAEVARRVAAGGVALSPDELILAATHTHHGPVNYMTSRVYASAGPLPWGFDRALFDFLAGRVAEAVAEAAREAAPAELLLRDGHALDVQRNRALAAFARNPAEERRAILDAARSAGQSCPDGARDCPRYQAVDPSLTILEARRAGRPPLHLVFFAVHPTAMTHDSPLYSPDFTGLAMHRLEEDTGGFAGFFNGAEGDVTPRWVRQDRTDVLALGERLRTAARDLLALPGRPLADAGLHVSTRAVETPPAEPGLPLLHPPRFGAAALGGAEDGPTWLRTYLFAGLGDPRSADGKLHPFDRLGDLCHGLLCAPARVLAKALLAPRPGHFPDRLPLTLARFGDGLALGALPVEMTTAMGRRVRLHLSRAVRGHVVLVGLANEYLSYVTTEEEYAAHAYEGDSTLFGPGEGEALDLLLASLAQAPVEPRRVVPRRVFTAAKLARGALGPPFLGERRPSADDDLEPVMPDAQGRVDDRARRFAWTESPPDRWTATERRRVTLLGPDAQGGWRELEDEDEGNLLTVLLEADGGTPRQAWAAFWTPPPGPAFAEPRMIRVRTGDDRQLCSRPFVAAASTPEIGEGACPEG